MNKSMKERGPGHPHRGSSEDLKQTLLNEAMELFGQRGFDGVSLSQIAGQSNVDVGLTRYYFGSKADLWEAAMSLLAENFANELAQNTTLGESSKTDDLKSIITAFIFASARWPQVSRIIVFDGNRSDERGAFIAARFVTPFFDLLSQYISSSKKEGTLPDVSERTIFFMITHGGSFPMALPALTNTISGGDINSEEGLAEHANAIIALIFDK